MENLTHTEVDQDLKNLVDQEVDKLEKEKGNDVSDEEIDYNASEDENCPIIEKDPPVPPAYITDMSGFKQMSGSKKILIGLVVIILAAVIVTGLA